MRNNDPIFWPEASIDLSLRQSMEKNYSDCINILQTQWFQFDLDERFSMGEQDLWGLIFPGVATYRRKIFNFNLLNRGIQMISGHERRNRKSMICIPTMNQYQKTADQITKCMYHVFSKAGTYQLMSDAFEMGALVQGLGFIAIYVDYKDDPVNGDICFRYVDPKSTLYDPYFRSNSMEDARFFWCRQYLDRNEAALIHPQFADQIMSMPRGTYRDDKFYYMPEVYQIQFPNLIAFDEYWYQSTRDATFLVDVESNEVQEWKGTEEALDEKMRGRIKLPDGKTKDTRKAIKVIRKKKPTVRRAVVVNDRVFVDEPNPYGLDVYPYVPVIGYMHADSPYYAYKFRGAIRDCRDSAYLFNRRKVADLDILEAQQQGLKIKKGALVTPDDALNQGNGRILSIDPNFQMSDVEPMPIVPPAPQLLEMENMLKEVMMQIMGVNEELLGMDADDKSGILNMLRQSAATTTLQKMFDQMDESKRHVGNIVVELIQKWSIGKVRQVIGEEPTFEFKDKIFFQYGCKVVPGVMTESQKQLEAQQLIYLRGELGMPISSKRILEAMTFQNKDEIIKETIEAEQQQMQMQAEQAKIQMQKDSVEAQVKMSDAQSKISLAQERMAKIQLDKALNAERLQRAEEERTASLLNIMKTLKEIKSMDMDEIERSLSILNGLAQNIKGGQNERENEQSGISPR